MIFGHSNIHLELRALFQAECGCRFKTFKTCGNSCGKELVCEPVLLAKEGRAKVGSSSRALGVLRIEGRINTFVFPTLSSCGGAKSLLTRARTPSQGLLHQRSAGGGLNICCGVCFPHVPTETQSEPKAPAQLSGTGSATSGPRGRFQKYPLRIRHFWPRSASYGERIHHEPLACQSGGRS